MHGNWDDQTATWDSLTEEYRWDFIEFLDSLSLGSKSGLVVKKPSVTFRVSGSLGTKTGIETDSKGSSFKDSLSFGCKSKVTGVVNSITGYESLSLGSKSGFKYTSYRLFMNSLGVLSMASDVGVAANTNVTLATSFSTRSGLKGSPAGSIYNLDSALKMRTNVSPDGTKSIVRAEASLGSKSGLEKALNTVDFDVDAVMRMSASLQGLGVTTIPVETSLGMKASLFAASGNTFFESCKFNGVISDTHVVNYTARDVVFFASNLNMSVESLVNFDVSSLMEMGMSYTARDGWWIRPIIEEGSGWDADNTVGGNWTADDESSGNGWTPEDF